MRGEHAAIPSTVMLSYGSSPHARGARVFPVFWRLTTRIIPACAGSTKGPSSIARTRPDHPRMRGEHAKDSGALWSDQGSSPHARGAPSSPLWPLSPRRIIPACAGSTCATPSNPAAPGDHPRMRGEHVRAFQSSMMQWGSSPHARGAPIRLDRLIRRVRIIPACAGSTAE